MKFLIVLSVVAVVSCQEIHHTEGGSEYHFSWLSDGGKEYSFRSAKGYCTRLGRGWDAISIETPQESTLASKILSESGRPWVWTGAQKRGSSFTWPSGAKFVGLNWSHTGGNKKPQPDNRERGGENCVAILNNFYDDGVKWHDVACDHKKGIICERRL